MWWIGRCQYLSYYNTDWYDNQWKINLKGHKRQWCVNRHDSYTMVGTIGDEGVVKVMVEWIGGNFRKTGCSHMSLFIGMFLFSCFLSGDTIYYTNQYTFLISTNFKWACPACFSTPVPFSGRTQKNQMLLQSCYL